MPCFNNVIPSAVEIRFPKLICVPMGGDEDFFIVTVPISELDCASSFSDYTGFDGVKTFHETAHAVVMLSDDEPINLADLQSLANRIACDYYQFQSISQDLVYNGVVAWNPCGVTDCVEFTYDANEITTRIIGKPANGDPEELMHEDWSTCPGSSSSGSNTTTVKVTDLKCESGNLNIYGVNVVYAPNGTLLSVSSPFKVHSAGCCDCPSAGCQVFCIQVNDPTTGDPVSGLTATIHGYIGTTPWSTSGTTNGDGQFCYTLPTSGSIPTALAAIVYSPDPTCYASSSFAQTGSTCYAYFTYCAEIIVINTVDGDSGSPLSGVTLVGPFFIDGDQTCIESTNTNEVVDGGTHTFTTYTILNASGQGCSQTAINYAVGCKSGYWGGCLPVGELGTCGQTTTYTLYMWSRSNWNLNVQGLCLNGRAEVYPKTLCATAAGPPQVLGSNAGTGITVSWVDTSWDGDPLFTGPHVMIYTGCVPANGAYGECNGVHVPYGNLYVEVRISIGVGGQPNLVLKYQPLWVTCDPNTDVTPTCLDGDGDRVSAYPALYCPAPSPPNPAGSYYFEMPYVITWGGFGWSGPSAVDAVFVNAPIDLIGPVVGNPVVGVVSGWYNSCSFYFCNPNPGGPGGETDTGNPDCSIPNGTCTLTESCGDYFGAMGIMSLDRSSHSDPNPFPMIETDKIRVGIVAPCMVQGGAEYHTLSLVKSFDSRFSIQGIAVTGPSVSGEMISQFPCVVSNAPHATEHLLNQCDVVISWAFIDLSVMLPGMQNPPKVVYVCHLPRIWSGHEASTLAKVDHVVAVSELAKNAVSAELRDRTSVIWNAVDRDRMEVRRQREEVRNSWGIAEDHYVVGYLGRIEEEKDPGALIRMAWSLPSRFKVVIVGDGSMMASLKATAPPNVIFAGADDDAGSVLNAFDHLVVPSRYESFGLTMVEGWWQGLPVISTEVGIASLVPNLTRLVPYGADGETLAGALMADLEDSEGTMNRILAATDYAWTTLGLERFGREWNDLLVGVLGE